MEKKTFFWPLVICLILIFSSLVIQNAMADETIEIPNPLGETSIFNIIDRIINFIFWISIPIAIVMIMWGGLQFIFSQGNPKKIPNAAKIIQYTLIGFVVVLLAKGIVYVVRDIITGSGSPQSNTSTNVNNTAQTIFPNAGDNTADTNNWPGVRTY